MWKDILKVDEFTSEGGFKGLYDPKEDKVKVNLDRFKTVAEGYDDIERVVEFANVVTHELSHREYSKELNEEMNKTLDELFEIVKKYAQETELNNKQKTLKLIEEKYKIWLNYAIINESFAFGSGKSFERLSHLDGTRSSVRFVMGQVNEHLRKLIGKKDKQLEIMLGDLYSEVMRAIKK